MNSVLGANFGFGAGGSSTGGTGVSQIRLGWLSGLDNSFNKAINGINQDTTPQWQQQISVTDAYAQDVAGSFLNSSSFYQPVRMTKMGNHLQDVTKPAEHVGLSEQIIAPKLYDAGTDNALDYLNRSDTLFQGVLAPDFGKNLSIPVDLVNTLPGGPVFPTFSNFPPEALNFFGLQSVLPFYTQANVANNNMALQQYPVNSPLRYGMPIQAGQVQVQPLQFPPQNTTFTLQDLQKEVTLGLGGGLLNTFYFQLPNTTIVSNTPIQFEPVSTNTLFNQATAAGTITSLKYANPT